MKNTKSGKHRSMVVKNITIPISEYEIEKFRELINGNQSKITWNFEVGIDETIEEPEYVNLHFVTKRNLTALEEFNRPNTAHGRYLF